MSPRRRVFRHFLNSKKWSHSICSRCFKMIWTTLVLLVLPVVPSNSSASFIQDFALHEDIKVINWIVPNFQGIRFHINRTRFHDLKYWSFASFDTFQDHQGRQEKGGNEKTPMLHVVQGLDWNTFAQLDLWVESGTRFDLWLVEGCITQELMTLLRNVSLDESVFFFCPNGSESVWVSEGYWVSGLNHPVIHNVSKWSVETGLDPFPSIYVRRRDLQQAILRTTVETWAPYAVATKHGNGSIEFTGFFAEIVESLSDIMNFSVELSHPSDGFWGHLLPNKGWSGMVGQIVRDEADFSPGGFAVTEERMKVVDYLDTIFVADGTIFFRNPTTNFNWLAYLQPLLWQVWAVIVLLFLTMPFVIATSANLPPIDKNAREFSLVKSFIFVFGALTFGRRWSVTPFTSSTRVIFFLITISGLMVQWHWKAGIISMLTVNVVRYPFHDLAGVLGSDHKLLIYPAGNLLTYFELSQDPVIKGLWERDIKNEYETWPSTYENGLIDMAMQEDIAFFEYFEGPVTISEQYRTCQLISTKKTLLPAVFTFILQKNSSFHGIFNHYLNILKEKGMFNKMAVYYKPPPQECSGGRGSAIGVNNVITALSIFGLGFLACLLCFGSELFVGRYCQIQTKQILPQENEKNLEDVTDGDDWFAARVSKVLKIHKYKA